MQCVGSTPVNLKGGIAVGTSTTITVKERKLQLANPGYVWNLSAEDAATAQWMGDILVAAIQELKSLYVCMPVCVCVSCAFADVFVRTCCAHSCAHCMLMNVLD